jgi:hypothetical protein
MGDEFNYFLQMDMKAHLGEWVAISNKKIIASGKNVKEVIKQARAKEPQKRPFVTKVPERVAMIF